MNVYNKQVNKDGKMVVVKEGLNCNLREVLYRTNPWIHLFMLNALCKLCCVLYTGLLFQRRTHENQK